MTRAFDEQTGDTADQDASVWDWAVDGPSNLYLGEPDRDTTVELGGQTVLWPDYPDVVPGHPAALMIDQVVQSTYLLDGSPVTFDAGGYIGTRPKLLFNPTNGRPAWPLLRPHIGKRPPFSPNGHSGAPYLGESGGAAAEPVIPVGSTSTEPIDPWANRDDAICPAGAPVRTFNVVGIAVPIQVTNPDKSNQIDPLGALDVLAEDKDAVYAGTKVYAGVQSREPLTLRGNVGDCIAVTYTSELTDGGPEVPYSKTNIHIHHVQFDTQASDGVISGFSFEQSIRPYKLVDSQLTTDAPVGATVLTLSSVTKFGPGVWIAVGEGTEGIEVRQITSVDAALSQVTISEGLANAHPTGEWAGTEFVQYRWYPDVVLDNVFFHDHVNGIHGWSHGMVGQLIIEPWGSTYHDPVTGEEIRAGAIADIRTAANCVPQVDRAGMPAGTSNQCVLIPGVIDGSFREFAMFTISDHNPVEATINLRAEPWLDRAPDPTQLLQFCATRERGPLHAGVERVCGRPGRHPQHPRRTGLQHAVDRRTSDVLGTALPRRNRHRVEPDRHHPLGGLREVHPRPERRCRRSEPCGRRLPVPRRRESPVRGRCVGFAPSAAVRHLRCAPTTSRLRGAPGPAADVSGRVHRSTTSPSAPSISRVRQPAEATTVERRRSCPPRSPLRSRPR